MPVLVEDVTMAKSGKSRRVKLSGSYYGSYLDSGIETQIGKLIEAEIVTLDKGGPWIKAWKPSAAPQAIPAAPVQPGPLDGGKVYKYAEPSDNVQPWYMPFVSNTVAHAIAAGKCETPEAVNQWALKAAQVAVAVKEAVK